MWFIIIHLFFFVFFWRDSWYNCKLYVEQINPCQVSKYIHLCMFVQKFSHLIHTFFRKTLWMTSTKKRQKKQTNQARQKLRNLEKEKQKRMTDLFNYFLFVFFLLASHHSDYNLVFIISYKLIKLNNYM